MSAKASKADIVAIIPARGGSKRLPEKNILDLAGKPLIGWTIEAALGSAHIARVIVSTDDENIAEIARKFGAEVPYIRPKHLSADTTVTVDVVEHLLEKIGEPETIILLQPTSPLRTSMHIDEAVDLYRDMNANAVVSVCATEHPVEWCTVLPADGCMDGFIDQLSLHKRSQDFQQRYRINGALYLASVKQFLAERTFIMRSSTFAYVMERENSVDIDDKFDFMLAEILMKKHLSA